ncbi:MAG TPA: AAA family ATPase [Nitrospiria bacterium]|nr:AAA family ATPase [Nitrospiria bacterium]
MYQQFFQFRRLPFQPTPDPNFFFFTSRHEEAFNQGLYTIRERKGFMVLTGEVGTGKTTLSRLLIEQLGPSVKSSLIFNPNLTTVELLQSINHDFGINGQSYSKKILTDELNRFLLEQLMQDGNAVLIIDEAQTLSVDCLEEVRLLSNLETPRAKLLQILLIGQPELMDKLALPQLRQLNQRIVVRAHLTPLEPQEVADYIRYRLWRAGGREAVHFEAAALELVYRYSGGVPRLVNALCDRALLAAYVRGTRLISGYLMSQAIGELAPILPVTEPPPIHLTREAPAASARARRDPMLHVAAIGLTLLLIGLGAMWWNADTIQQHFPMALLARDRSEVILPPPVDLPSGQETPDRETPLARSEAPEAAPGLRHDMTAGGPVVAPPLMTTPSQPSLPTPSGTDLLTPFFTPPVKEEFPDGAPAATAVRIPLLPMEVVTPSRSAPDSAVPSSAPITRPPAPHPPAAPLAVVSAPGGPASNAPSSELKVDHSRTRMAAAGDRLDVPVSTNGVSTTPPVQGHAASVQTDRGGAVPPSGPDWYVDANDVIRASTPELMERAALLMLLHQWGAVPDWPPVRPNGLVNADPAALARERRLELLQVPLTGHELLELDYPAIAMRKSGDPGRPPHPVVITRVINGRVILLDPGAGFLTRPASAIDQELTETVRLYWRPLNGWRWPGPVDGIDPVVRWLQTRLHDRQLYRGPIDGLAGPDTEQALRQWAGQRGLIIPASDPLMDLLISQLLEPAGFPHLSLPDSGTHAGRGGAGGGSAAPGQAG